MKPRTKKAKIQVVVVAAVVVVIGLVALVWPNGKREGPSIRAARSINRHALEPVDRPTVAEPATPRLTTRDTALGEGRLALIRGESEGSFQDRVQALREVLEVQADTEELGEVIQFIRDVLPEEADPRERAWRARLRLLVMDILGERRPLREDLGQAYLEIARNEVLSVRERETAVRHLGLWGEALASHPEDWARPQVKEVRSVLTSLTESNEITLPGTALIALHRISTVFPDIPLVTLARVMSDRETLSPESRTTALQVLALEHPKKGLAMAREIVTASSDELLQVVAIRVIRDLAPDSSFLETVRPHLTGPFVAGIGMSKVLSEIDGTKSNIAKED